MSTWQSGKLFLIDSNSQPYNTTTTTTTIIVRTILERLGVNNIHHSLLLWSLVSHSGVLEGNTRLFLSALQALLSFHYKTRNMSASRPIYGYPNTIKSNKNCCCCCCCCRGKHPRSSERRSCTSKRVSVISLYSPLDYTSWAHQNHHNYSHFARIYSNAVSYLWGNYEHFCKEDLSVLTKEIVRKKICCRKTKKEKGENRWASFSWLFL